MAKLTVWIAEQSDDHPAYNIVARTKKDALRQIAERPSTDFEAPRKVELFYRDAFDLYEMVTGEGGGRSMF